MHRLADEDLLLLAGANEPSLVCGHDRLRPTAESELREDPVHVCLHRREADEQRGGDVLVREAAREEAEHFAFPLGELAKAFRDNVLVGDDSAKVTFEREGIYTDQTTSKPVAATTRYTYQDGEDRYLVSFTRTHDLSVSRLVDTIKGVKRIAAKLVHFDGAYLRFVGDLEISRYRGGELVETHKDDAIWELMYFGHPRDQ